MKNCTPAALSFIALIAMSQAQQPKLNAADRILAHDVLKQLIEINTSHSVGSTTLAAEAMRKRFLDAGFPAKDMVVMGPDDRHGNLVLRYHGKPGNTLKPTLIIAHLDVVEAKREDWTTVPSIWSRRTASSSVAACRI